MFRLAAQVLNLKPSHIQDNAFVTFRVCSLETKLPDNHLVWLILFELVASSGNFYETLALGVCCVSVVVFSHVCFSSTV